MNGRARGGSWSRSTLAVRPYWRGRLAHLLILESALSLGPKACRSTVRMASWRQPSRTSNHRPRPPQHGDPRRLSADLGGVVRLRRPVPAGQHHARVRQGAQHAPQPPGHPAVLRPPPAQPLPGDSRPGRGADRGGGGRAPGPAGLQVRRPAGPLLRRRHPSPLRRHRGPGFVPDPADPRGRAGRHREEGKIMTALVAPETLAVPASHLDLLTRPICGVLTTMGGDGQPQSSLVWVDWDGACARVNTTLERQKGHNLAADPKVSLLVVDPDNPARYLQLRGHAELVFDDALDYLDKLTRRYPRHPGYYGHIYPAAQRWRETRVICRIHPRRITLDAIHA